MNSALRSLTASWPWTTVDVLNHLWQSTVVGVVVLAVLLLGRGLSARTRRMLGWLALIKFVLPAGFFVQMFAQIGATPVRWVEAGALAGPITLPGFVATAPAAEAPAPVSIGLVVTLVWLAGFLGLVTSWLVRGRILRRQLFAELQPVSQEVKLRILAAAERVGLREAPRCFAVDGERAPGALGVVAPIVILPRGLEAMMAPAEFESVLIHELVHVQRRDNLWTAVQALFVSLFWFHPIVWLLNRRLALETEQSCDERVLEITGDPDAYASGIVKAVRHVLGVTQPGLIGATTPPVIQRIKNIFSDHARRDQPLVRGAALAGGALLLALSGYTGSFVVPVRAATPTAAAPAAAPTPIATPPAGSETKSLLTPAATGTWGLSSTANTYTGVTTVNGGTLTFIKAGAGTALGAGTLTLFNPTDTFTGTTSITRPAGTGTLSGMTSRVTTGITTIGSSMTLATPPPRDPASAPATGTGAVTKAGVGTLTLSGVTGAGAPRAFATPQQTEPTTGTSALTKGGAGTLTLSGNNNMTLSAAGTLSTAAAPVAISSLPAKAAEARLVAHTERLNAEAEALQGEIDAANATRGKNPEAPADPEVAAKVASLAALDARRRALDAAVAATADSAQLAALTEQREAEARQRRALPAQQRAKQPDMISLDAIDPRRLPTDGIPANPKASTGEIVGIELLPTARTEADAVRPSGTKVSEPSQRDHPALRDFRGIRVYDPGQLDQQPVPRFQARPNYPFALRRSNTSGEATVDFIVTVQGDVVSAYAVKFTHPEFGEAATAAVAKWKFRPGRKGGAAVNTHMQVPIVFTLNGN